MLSERLERVRTRIQHACQRRGRDPASITLVCVTKTIPPSLIREVVTVGATDVGENRVQEAREKRAALAGLGVRWHLIGHLQRNKAKDGVELFDAIHSVDSPALADALERHAAELRADRKPLEVFVQANISGEATKSGCRPEDVEALARQVRHSPHLRLCGLMTMAPWSEDPEDARAHFRRLRELRDRLDASLRLSMGMSNDFEVAIEEGADVVRIGTAIFGPHGSIT